ncbi:MAG: hypothetical protein ACI84C_002460 [Flavobacteriales bacterium]|jgi:hypothetical protein
MRLVKQIPHSHFRMSIFQWNAKYILEIELDRFKQVYKWGEEEVESTVDIEKLLTPAFLNHTMGLFLEMRKGINEISQTK